MFANIVHMQHIFMSLHADMTVCENTENEVYLGHKMQNISNILVLWD